MFKDAPENNEKKRFLARISWLYYSAGLTQQAIADRLGLNRVRVNKLLSEARDAGIVTIQFNYPYLNEFRLEEALCSKYGLKNVILVPTPENEQDLKKMIGQAAARYLDTVLSNNDVLATPWGETAYQLACWLKPRRKLNNLIVTHLMGAWSNSPTLPNPPNIAEIISDKYKAQSCPLFAPILVDNREIRDALLSDGNIKRTLEIARSATIALVGIGPVDRESIFVKAGYLLPDYIQVLRDKGAVGDLVGRYFDINGKPVRTEIDERSVSLDLTEIRNIELVIGIAGGPKKVMAIKGALNGKLLDVLVTDEETAQKILE